MRLLAESEHNTPFEPQRESRFSAIAEVLKRRVVSLGGWKWEEIQKMSWEIGVR